MFPSLVEEIQNKLLSARNQFWKSERKEFILLGRQRNWLVEFHLIKAMSMSISE